MGPPPLSPGPDLSDWMGHLPPPVKDLPLCHLALPGSHDSLTYSLEKSGGAGPDQPECIRCLTSCCPRLSSKLLYRWSLTQGADLAAQLRGGVRYFDIRLEAMEEGGERDFRVLHCLVGERVRGLLVQVRGWLEQHSGEVVILDLQHLFLFHECDHQQLAAFLLSTFQDVLHPWAGLAGRATLGSLQTSGHRVVVVYPRMASCSPLLWPRASCPTPWPDTTSTSTLASFLATGLQERDQDKLFVSQGVLTPRVSTVLTHPFSGLWKSCAQRANLRVLDWLESGARPNILIHDFVLGDAVSWGIISKILECNAGLGLRKPSCG